MITQIALASALIFSCAAYPDACETLRRDLERQRAGTYEAPATWSRDDLMRGERLPEKRNDIKDLADRP